MKLIDFIEFSCLIVFVLYWLSVNFFTKKKPNKAGLRPKISANSFFQKSKNSSISIEKADKLIQNSRKK
jgi:hypothetical protein